MKKYWNALRFGSSSVKRFLWSIIIMLGVTIGLSIAAAVTKSTITVIAALFTAVFTLILSQSVSLKNLEKKSQQKKIEKEKKEREKAAQENVKEDNQQTEESDYMEQYTKGYIEQLFVKYKVKKNVKTVMVDESEKSHIKQCPAYIWRERGKVYLLLLEKKPREVKIEKQYIQDLTLEKVPVKNREEEYQRVKGNGLVGFVFTPFLPTYYEVLKQGKKMQMKNLYCIRPDIKFTNTSVRVLMELLEVDVKIEDEVILSDLFSPFFKKIYRFNLLLKDGIIDVKDYKHYMQNILRSMIEVITEEEAFQNQLKKMVEYHLVTKEYAEYYTEQWKAIKKK